MLFRSELDGLGSFLVAEEALEGALAGPAAVSVHDDGDVLRNARGIERIVDRALFARQFVDTIRSLVDAAGGRFAHKILALMRVAEKAVQREPLTVNITVNRREIGEAPQPSPRQRARGAAPEVVRRGGTLMRCGVYAPGRSRGHG